MTLKNTNTNALLEKSFACGSGAGMKHIGFYLDGYELMVVGRKGGMNYIPEVHLKMTLRNSGHLEIVENMEIGNE
jgi:hypothetical protein